MITNIVKSNIKTIVYFKQLLIKQLKRNQKVLKRIACYILIKEIPKTLENIQQNINQNHIQKQKLCDI